MELPQAKDLRSGLLVENVSWKVSGQTHGLELEKIDRHDFVGAHASVTSKSTLVIGSLAAPFLVSSGLNNISLAWNAEAQLPSHIKLESLNFSAPPIGLALDMKGQADHVLSSILSGLFPVGEFESVLQIDNPTAAKDDARVWLPGIRSSGAFSAHLKLASKTQNVLLATGRLAAKDYSMWLEGSPKRLRTSDGKAHELLISIKDMNANLPLYQRIHASKSRGYHLKFPETDVLDNQFNRGLRQVRYRIHRPILNTRGNFRLGYISLEDRLFDRETKAVESTVRYRTGSCIADVRVGDGTAFFDRFYMKIFDGDIVGDLQFQLLPDDWRIGTRMQVTNIDLSYLNQARARIDERLAKAEVKAEGGEPQPRPDKNAYRGKSSLLSGLLDVRYQPGLRSLSGNAELKDIEMGHLINLLNYLDPHDVDPTVKANKDMLQKWYVKLFKPEIKKVSIDVDHSRLNMDLKIDAIWPLSMVIKRIFSNLRIRRLSIKPMLRSARSVAEDIVSQDAEEKEDDAKEKGSEQIIDSRSKPGAW